MIQGLIAKKAIDIILKKIMEKRELKNLKKYVEEDNDLDLITKVHGKALDKYGRTIEDLEKDVAILRVSSHAPVFPKNAYKDILKRLKKLEKKEK